jgi:hypothetical protein
MAFTFGGALSGKGPQCDGNNMWLLRHARLCEDHTRNLRGVDHEASPAKGARRQEMKTTVLTMIVFAFCTARALAGCEDSKAYFLNERPLPEKADNEIELAEFESTEGGAFSIYLNANKKPDRIVRTDFGETGRRVTKLVIGAPNDVMITSTLEHYNVPITQTGSFTNREETDFYYFCDGKLQQEPEAAMDNDYAKAAKEAADMFFSKAELQDQLKATGITPLIWK